VNQDATQLLSAARLAADEAARYLRTRTGRTRDLEWVAKGPSDFVTEVDKESERIIVARLTGEVPGSVVIGEELTPGAPGPLTTHPASVVWIVDPLDGTTNFLHGFPIYAVSIAAVRDGQLVAGIVHHVPLDLRYTATEGGGAFEDDRPLRVSTIADLRHALIGTGVPFTNMDQWGRYHRQIETVAAHTSGVRRPGSAALDLCDVAAGRTDGFWELRLAPWDIAAGTLIAREAGGLVTGLDGATDILRHGSIVAGNPVVHAWLMRNLAVDGGP
jgi:myo-inositol-1(or 4)-monophosphatase